MTLAYWYLAVRDYSMIACSRTVQLVACQANYDREKATALAELEAFKKRASAREKELLSEHNDRLTGLKVRPLSTLPR